jgi:predicted RNA-binding Zn ribbon-like protein
MTETQARKRQPPRFELLGNLCLDFINTLDNRPSAQPKELLERYTDLVCFAEDSGYLDPSAADYLYEHSNKAADNMEDALRRAIEMREAMYAVFLAVVEKRAVPAHPLSVLNGCIQDAASQAQLTPVGGGFEWQFRHLTSLTSLLWPIARAAADLLTSEQLTMVRTCSSATCQWFFLDTSKNHHRRWCSMKSCGNRAKVRRFYARKRTA